MNSQEELFTLLSYQSHLNKVLKTKATTPKTKEIFKKFSEILKQSSYLAEIKVSNFSCKFCSNPIKSPPICLPCLHVYCSESCFQELAFSQLQGQFHLIDRVKCLCNFQIPVKITRNILRNSPDFSFKIRKCQESSEPAINCKICWTLKKMRNFITLGCEHRYCEDCLKMHIQELIKNGEVGEKLICPECPNPIEYHIVSAHIDPKTKEQYERFLMMKIECKQYERYFACPGDNCTNAKIIPTDFKVFECEVCNLKYCVNCKDKEHINMSCEDNIQDKNIDDPLIKKKIEDQEIKKCPWCSIFIERDPRGCKYMTCKSKECNGKRWFCFDCRIKLKKFHEPHQCVTPEVETRSCLVF